MDSREKAFREKFASAGKHLGVAPNRIISLKLRDSVNSYVQYHEMLHILEHEAGICFSKLAGNLQGQGYLVEHEGQKIILVEHETGLEILYIAGSIASLIGLVPVVLQCWGSIRGYIDHRNRHQFRDIEIRRLDDSGNIQEEHSCGLAGPATFPLSIVNTALSAAARIIDEDICALRNDVQALSTRLATVEKQLSVKTASKPKNPRNIKSRNVSTTTHKTRNKS